MERARKDLMIEIWRHLQERLKEQRVNERDVVLLGSFVPVLFIHLFNKYLFGPYSQWEGGCENSPVSSLMQF